MNNVKVYFYYVKNKQTNKKLAHGKCIENGLIKNILIYQIYTKDKSQIQIIFLKDIVLIYLDSYCLLYL